MVAVRLLKNTFLPLFILLVISSNVSLAAGGSVSFTDIDRFISPVYDLAKNACAYTGGFSGWDWTCSVYDSLQKLRGFVHGFQGRARDIAIGALRSSFAGVMESVGSQPFMNSINDYARRINQSADYWFDKFPDQLAEDVDNLFYDLSYKATDQLLNETSNTNPYPPLSAPWFYDNVKQHGALAGVLHMETLFSTKRYLGEKERVEFEKAKGQEALAGLEKQAALAGKRTFSIASDPGTLGDSDGNQNATATQGRAAPLAADTGSNTANGGGGGSEFPKPLSYLYKKQAQTAVSSRDLLQIVSSELADLLSSQALATSDLVQAAVAKTKATLVTNDHLAQLVEMEAERMRRETERANEAIAQQVTNESLEFMNKVAQLAVAQKSLGLFTDPNTVSVAVTDFNNCLDDISLCGN